MCCDDRLIPKHEAVDRNGQEKAQEIASLMRSIPIIALLLLSAKIDAQEYHTSPYCWDSARIYASGETERVQVSVVKLESASVIDGTLSPNGAYRFEITGRGKESDPDWYPRLIIFNERAYLLEVRFPNTKSISEAEWINENLIFVRLWWGQIAGSDFIFDAEKEAVVYQQPIRWGEIAFRQYQQCAADDWKHEEQCQCLDSPGK